MAGEGEENMPPQSMPLRHSITLSEWNQDAADTRKALRGVPGWLSPWSLRLLSSGL